MIGRVEGAGPGELNLNVESYVLAYVQMILGTWNSVGGDKEH